VEIHSNCGKEKARIWSAKRIASGFSLSRAEAHAIANWAGGLKNKTVKYKLPIAPGGEMRIPVQNALRLFSETGLIGLTVLAASQRFASRQVRVSIAVQFRRREDILVANLESSLSSKSGTGGEL
jgi:hypothetical protein